jgi:hypothetical protein
METIFLQSKILPQAAFFQKHLFSKTPLLRHFASCKGFHCPLHFSRHPLRPFSAIVPNGYVLAMVGHLKNVSPTFAQMPNSSTNVEFIPVSPTIANTMLADVINPHQNGVYTISFTGQFAKTLQTSLEW